MSEATQERETEVIQGTIEGVTQKKPDTWQVVVRPDNSQYTKNLWTKDATLVAALTAKLGQHGAFVCNASYWNRQDGQQVRSLWISSHSEGDEEVPGDGAPAPRPAPKASAPPAGPLPRESNQGMSKEEWARKDSAIHKMACIKTAADALKHTVPADPSTEDLNLYITRVTHLSLAWHRQVLAERDDPAGESIPF